jgi:transposase-like protein
VERIEAGGEVEIVAQEMGVSEETTHRWLNRYQEQVGLQDPNSRRHSTRIESRSIADVAWLPRWAGQQSSFVWYLQYSVRLSDAPLRL